MDPIANNPSDVAAIQASAGDPPNPFIPPIERLQRPTVGRIVHYIPPDGLGAKSQPYAAVITHVSSERCVNLNVINDGSFAIGEHDRTPSSVCLGVHPAEQGVRFWPPRS